MRHVSTLNIECIGGLTSVFNIVTRTHRSQGILNGVLFAIMHQTYRDFMIGVLSIETCSSTYSSIDQKYETTPDGCSGIHRLKRTWGSQQKKYVHDGSENSSVREQMKMDSRREHERVEGELIFFRVEAFVLYCRFPYCRTRRL